MTLYKVRFVADFEVTVDAEHAGEAVIEAFDRISQDTADEHLSAAGVREVTN